MPWPTKNPSATPNNGATVGYEAQLWPMADTLRGSMDVPEYKHVVLGLVFLEQVSNALAGYHTKLAADRAGRGRSGRSGRVPRPIAEPGWLPVPRNRVDWFGAKLDTCGSGGSVQPGEAAMCGVLGSSGIRPAASRPGGDLGMEKLGCPTAN